jgi:hypothetical protein
MFPKLLLIVSSAAQNLRIFVDWFKAVNLYFHSHFGLLGQLAFDLALFYFLFLVVSKIFKAAFELVLYVVIPSLVLSFVTSFVLPFTFATILPMCVGLLIVVNIFRLA